MNENIKHLNGDFEVTRAEDKKLKDATKPHQATIDRLKKEKPSGYKEQIAKIRNAIEYNLKEGK